MDQWRGSQLPASREGTRMERGRWELKEQVRQSEEIVVVAWQTREQGIGQSQVGSRSIAHSALQNHDWFSQGKVIISYHLKLVRLNYIAKVIL